MRAALYLRVSTAEQTTDNQERELRAAAARICSKTRAGTVSSGSIALHLTARAGGSQVRAQFLGACAAFRPDADPRPTHAAAREPTVDDAWLPVRQNGGVLLLQSAIRGKRRRVG